MPIMSYIRCNNKTRLYKTVIISVTWTLKQMTGHMLYEFERKILLENI
jgi:hypothetical protein